MRWRQIRRRVFVLIGFMAFLAIVIQPLSVSCPPGRSWTGPDLRAEYRLAVLRGMLNLRDDWFTWPGHQLMDHGTFDWSGLTLTVGDRMYMLTWETMTDLPFNAASKSVNYITRVWVEEGLSQGPVYDHYRAMEIPGFDGMRAEDETRCPAMKVIVTPGVPRTGFVRDAALSEEEGFLDD